ncbi:MAG: substrate-binding domain-containing protein [bacterium]
MSRAAYRKFGVIWTAASTVILAVAIFVSHLFIGGGSWFTAVIVSVIMGFAVSGVLGVVFYVFRNRFLRVGTMEREEARGLSDSLMEARRGDLSSAWPDINLEVNGDSRQIPFSKVYEQLVGVMAEADRMGTQLNGLSQEILVQAAKLSEGAEDQRQSVTESTLSVATIDTSTREILGSVAELGQLGDSVSSSSYQMMASIDEVNRTVQSLSDMVKEVVTAIDQITGNIHAVAESTETLSGAASQSKSSMEDIGKTTKSIRDRAESSAGMSEKAREGASHSKELLASAVSKIKILSDSIDSTRSVMQDLGVKSRSIGEILNVISSVTADTHLLSLNASIMAAKAGEHGRGFAVVAQEIKTLAQRTSESAKEIEGLIVSTQESVDRAIQAIEDGVQQVSESMSISEEADQALADVVKKTQTSAENARRIASDTDGQAETSEQVLTAADEVANRTELIRTAMREQEDSIKFVQSRSSGMKEHMEGVAQSMSEQSEASSRISQSMETLTGSIEGIRQSTEEQVRSNEGIVHAIDVIRKKADVVAISAQYVNNTAMSVLHHSHLLQHELKGIRLPEKKARFTIGLLFDNLREERWQREERIFIEYAEKLGLKIEFRVAAGDPARQLQLGRELLQAGVDLMIVVAVDAERAAEIINEAKENKTPAIAYDRLIKKTPLDLFVSFDAVGIGEIQARTALEKARGNRVMVLAGSPHDVNAHFLYQGQMKVLKPEADRGSIKIVDEVWVPDWEPRQAYQLTKRVIEQKGAIDAVVAANDGTAGGAIQAIKELLPREKVAVTGMDAELSACQRIVEGSQAMSVYMPIRLQAVRTLEAALLMLHNEEIPGITDRVDNEAARVPSILLKPVKIDADNLEEVVVKDGFHKREDIYRKA